MTFTKNSAGHAMWKRRFRRANLALLVTKNNVKKYKLAMGLLKIKAHGNKKLGN